MSLPMFMLSMMTSWRSSGLIRSDYKAPEDFRAPSLDASRDSSVTINKN
jgi:hypothetical protein